MATVYFSGYVFRDNGTALSGATVALLEAGTTTEEASTTTDSDGFWSFNETDDDRYDVKITSGSQIRYRKWADEIQVKTLDVRNNEGETVPVATFTNLANADDNEIVHYRSLRGTGADNDEMYFRYYMDDASSNTTEVARMTVKLISASAASEDSEIRWGVAVGGSIVDVFTISNTSGGATDMTVDVAGDISLDADGGDVFFKDGGTTFGSATNNSGNLIIKSATTTALTFSGANLTAAGTIDSGAITSSGSITSGGSFIIGSASIAEAELEMIDGITAGTVAASKAVVVDSNKDIGTFRNVTIDGTFSDGNYTFDTSGNVTGLGTVASGNITSSGTVQGTTITATTAFVPDASDGAALGTTSLEFSDLYLADGAVVGFGDDQDVTLTHVADTGLILSSTDQLQFGDSGTFIHQSSDGVLTITSDTTVDINGAVVFDGNVSGLGTVSSGAITSSGSVTSGGSFIIGSADINETDLEKIDGITDGTAASNKAVVLDGSKNIATIGTIGSGAITSTGTSSFGSGTTIGNLTLANGSITDSGGALDFGNETLTTTGAVDFGAATVDSLSVSDANITNVADIALDSISADGTDINIAVSDNSATALTIKQGSDAYLIVDTANSSESVSIGTGISGTAITLGHGTSEVTVGDNLTVTGDLTVSGTTTTVSSSTLTIGDTLIKLGQAYTGSAYDQGIIFTRGDGSDSNTANRAMLWDESADIFVFANTNTEAGTTSGNVTINDYASIRVGAITADDNSTFTGTISAATGSTIGNLTLANGSITDSSGAIDFGNETLTTTGVVTAGGFTIGSAAILEAELEILDGATVTTTELNLIDGDTARGTTAVASGDGILINDGGTMRMTNVDTVSTYFSSHNVGGGNIVTTGALDSGSITSGFGNIDTGSSTITTTGLISGGSLDIDDVLINGTTIGHTDDTDLITLADGVMTVAGEIDGATLDLSSSADIAGDLVLSGGADGALQFTNAGENSIKIPDNQASALIIEEANNAYITFNTTNSSEAITVAKATTFSAGIANAGTISAGTWNGTAIATAYIADNAINEDKIADDAIRTAHIEDGQIALAHMGSQSVDEDNLYISNTGNNGEFLSKQSGNNGVMTWAVPTNTTYSGGTNLTLSSTTFNVDDAFLINDGNDTTSGIITAAGFIQGNMTIDGTEIDLSSGDLTLDVASDIILDTASYVVSMQGTGTEWLKFYSSSSDSYIYNPLSDEDIYIRINDGGTQRNAIFIDASDLGHVYTNHDLTLNNSGVLAAATGDFVDIDVDGTAEVDNLTINGSQGNDGDVLTSTGSGIAWEAASGGGLTAGKNYVNESAESKITYGIAINQGTETDKVMTFKSSNVNHGMTDLAVETDTFGDIQRTIDGSGGLSLMGYTSATQGLAFTARGTSGNTTKSTSGTAYFRLQASKKSGASSGAAGADENLLAIHNHGTTRFIFDAEGSAHADVEWTTFSDGRLKTNQQPLAYGMKEIRLLQPKSYVRDHGYLEDGVPILENRSYNHIGFIAQEVKEIIPEIVKDIDERDSFYALDDGKLMAVVVKALQEIDNRILALEGD